MAATYQETLEYLYKNLPMFQHVGMQAYKKDLTNTIALCDLLGNPHQKIKTLHIAGTNGKGSSAHMLAAIFQSAGYKTGLYTSPHLKSFTERIKINGVEMSEQDVVDFVEQMRPHVNAIRPSFFELTVAMAFDHFYKHRVDIAVIETGLGGRRDSTNVIMPELSLITNIGLDHQQILGDTLPAIASEKAGIIKPGVPAVISERQPEVASIFEEAAGKGQLFFASDRYSVRDGMEQTKDIYRDGKIWLKNVQLPLLGSYQHKNVGGVVMVTELFRDMGWNISDEHLRQGLEQVLSLTGLKGRWQILSKQPWIICDTGHNVDGIRSVVAQLNSMRFESLWMIIGMVNDKDHAAILNLLPKNAHYFFTEAKIPRALKATSLFQLARDAGLSGEVVEDVNNALRHAKERATSKDLIFIGGSTFTVAEIEGL